MDGLGENNLTGGIHVFLINLHICLRANTHTLANTYSYQTYSDQNFFFIWLMQIVKFKKVLK